MEVTNDVVRDLLPVYMAGEASQDTCALVEEFLARNPELAELAEAARSHSLPPVALPSDLEVQSLDRTRALLAHKNFWMGFSLIFSFLPLVNQPAWLAALELLLGLVGWAVFLDTCRRLSATGLQARRSWWRRWVWAEVGVLVGVVIGISVERQTGWRGAQYYFPALSFALAAIAGEKLHQIPTMEELHRPTTLFGSSDRDRK